MKLRYALLLASAAGCLLAVAAPEDEEAAALPPGDGKPALVKVCGECHGYDSIRKLRINKQDWSEKVADMVDRGAKGTDQEMAAIISYLTANFGPNSRIWMNTAPFGELKSVLGLTNGETDALIAYRKQNPPFKNVGDVLKVTGVDPKKVEAVKDKMAF